MNAYNVLEWLFENGADKEPQKRAADLGGEASSGAGRLQCQQKAASNISRCLARLGGCCRNNVIVTPQKTPLFLNSSLFLRSESSCLRCMEGNVHLHGVIDAVGSRAGLRERRGPQF